MFGCIKNLVEVIIIIFALIGFFAIGGDKFVKNLWLQYNTEKPKQTTIVENSQTSNKAKDVTFDLLKSFFENQKNEK